VVYPVLEFREKKQERGNVDFFFLISAVVQKEHQGRQGWELGRAVVEVGEIKIPLYHFNLNCR